MPLSSFPSFLSSSATAQPSASNASDQTDHEGACNFMPQTVAPLVVMSTTRRSPSADADLRAQRLLRPNSLSKGYHSDMEDSEDELPDHHITLPPKPTTKSWLLSACALPPNVSFISILKKQRRPGLIAIIFLSLSLACAITFRVNCILYPVSCALHMVSWLLATVIGSTGWVAGRLCAWFMEGFARGYNV